MLRGLVFLLFAQADHDQYHNCNHIGQHLDQIGHVAGNGNAKQAGQELIQPVQHAKQVSAPNGVQRLPGGKDDQRYQPKASIWPVVAQMPWL